MTDEVLSVGLKQHIDQRTQCLWAHMLSVGPSQTKSFMCIYCNTQLQVLYFSWTNLLGHGDTNEP